MPSPSVSDAPVSLPPWREWGRIAREIWGQSRPIRIAGRVFIALLIALVGTWLWAKLRPANPLLATPVLALESVQAKSLYYNGLAWGWLHEKRPELLGNDERSATDARVRSFAQAVQNPKLFRQLDRQYRFDKLLLVGDPSQYRPLLEHLLETRDWTLEYVDHTSVIFQRGDGPKWEPGRLAAVQAKLAHAPARDRAIFLAQTAGKLIALREPAAALGLLDEAQALDEKVPEIWSARAQYHLGRGEWKECEEMANHALKLAPGNLSALGAKAQALYSTKRFAEAYALSRQLVAKLPDDPGILFYHAKIAHEARAFADEASSLRKLIALAETNERPTSGYRVYLGQSLATAGEAQPALEEFQKALADPELPQEQRKFARDCVALIHSQTGGGGK